MTALSTRDTLVRELQRHIGAHADIVANDLLASGAVIDAATDRAWAERFLYAWATPYFGDDRADAVSAVQRAAAAALAESGGG